MSYFNFQKNTNIFSPAKLDEAFEASKIEDGPGGGFDWKKTSTAGGLTKPRKVRGCPTWGSNRRGCKPKGRDPRKPRLIDTIVDKVENIFNPTDKPTTKITYTTSEVPEQSKEKITQETFQQRSKNPRFL
tara:strand:- start:44 stop:433 length:390 start_codon:yes stop_codon:yes gene_type:complete